MIRGVFLCVWIAGCGGAATTSAGLNRNAAESEPEVRGSGTAADPLQLCHMNGGLGRTDYSYVASYRCSDGSVPLERDPVRGAQSRRGNVGAGPDGHVVDLYDVPCPSGSVELYVDAYHCGDDVDTEIDPNNLTRPQLVRMARMIREIHEDPSGERALQLRRELLMWVVETRQVSVVVCDAILGLLPQDARHPYGGELMISLAASVMEDGRDPVDPVRANLHGLYGVIVYYEAIVRLEGDDARDPMLEALLRMAHEQTLEARVREIVTGCDFTGMGVHGSAP